MEKLAARGYDEVLCQPTHIINGMEYEKMMGMLRPYKEQIPVIRVGNRSSRRRKITGRPARS